MEEEKKAPRLSILKPPKVRSPFAEIDFEKSHRQSGHRRVSFASSNFVKPFSTDEDKTTVWDLTYEEAVNETDSATAASNTSKAQIFIEDDKENIVDEPMSVDITTYHILCDSDDETQLKLHPNTENTLICYQDIEEFTCQFPAEIRETIIGNDDMEITCQILEKDNETGDMEITCQIPEFTKSKIILEKEGVENCVPSSISSSGKAIVEQIVKDDSIADMEFTCQIPEFPKSSKIILEKEDIENCIPSASGKAIVEQIAKDDSSIDMEFTCQIPQFPKSKIILEKEDIENCVPSSISASGKAIVEQIAKDDSSIEMEFTCQIPVFTKLVTDQKEEVKQVSSNGLDLTCEIPVTDKENLSITCQISTNIKMIAQTEETEKTYIKSIIENEEDVNLISTNSVVQNDITMVEDVIIDQISVNTITQNDNKKEIGSVRFTDENIFQFDKSHIEKVMKIELKTENQDVRNGFDTKEVSENVEPKTEMNSTTQKNFEEPRISMEILKNENTKVLPENVNNEPKPISLVGKEINLTTEEATIEDFVLNTKKTDEVNNFDSLQFCDINASFDDTQPLIKATVSIPRNLMCRNESTNSTGSEFEFLQRTAGDVINISQESVDFPNTSLSDADILKKYDIKLPKVILQNYDGIWESISCLVKEKQLLTTEVSEKLRKLDDKIEEFEIEDFSVKYKDEEDLSAVVEVHNSPPALIKRKPIRERIDELSHMADQYWKLDRVADGVYYFSTLFGKFTFDVHLDSHFGTVHNIETSTHVKDPSRGKRICYFILKVFEERFSSGNLELVLCKNYDVLSLLHYVNLSVEYASDINNEFEALQKEYAKLGIVMNTDLSVSFRVLNVPNIIGWKITVSLCHKNAAINNTDDIRIIDCSEGVGTGVNVEYIKEKAEQITKDIYFLRHFIQLVLKYSESVKGTKRFLTLSV